MTSQVDSLLKLGGLVQLEEAGAAPPVGMQAQMERVVI